MGRGSGTGSSVDRAVTRPRAERQSIGYTREGSVESQCTDPLRHARATAREWSRSRAFPARVPKNAGQRTSDGRIVPNQTPHRPRLDDFTVDSRDVDTAPEVVQAETGEGLRELEWPEGHRHRTRAVAGAKPLRQRTAAQAANGPGPPRPWIPTEACEGRGACFAVTIEVGTLYERPRRRSTKDPGELHPLHNLFRIPERIDCLKRNESLVPKGTSHLSPRGGHPYPTAEIMSKMGRYMATIMPPTTTPRTTIIRGSRAEMSALTAASTSSS